MSLDRAEERVLLDRVQRALGGQLAPEEAAAAAGDLDRLFASQEQRVYRVCFRIVGDPERARDLAQETMLTAWCKLPGFRGESRFSTWLHGIARHLCMNAVRKRSELLTADGLVEVGSPEAGAARLMHRHEREALVQRAAAALDPVEQEVVYLRYVEQLPVDRITAVLELEGSSGARGVLQRCRRKLAAELRGGLAALGHGTSFIRGTL